MHVSQRLALKPFLFYSAFEAFLIHFDIDWDAARK
jgi:hypothetical protein